MGKFFRAASRLRVGDSVAGPSSSVEELLIWRLMVVAAAANAGNFLLANLNNGNLVRTRGTAGLT
jgi:hypothetical protein